MADEASVAGLNRAVSAILNTRPNPVLFLGAGASISSGGRSAGAIADELALLFYPDSATGADARAAFTGEYEKPATFENLLDAIGTTGTQHRSVLARFFGRMTPSEGYAMLALLVLYGYFSPIILTTNFDTLLEDSLKEAILVGDWQHTVTVLLQEDITADLSSTESEILIVKLHGDLRKTDQPLRLTFRQTASLSGAAEHFISSLFERFGMTVVGYRAKDVSVRNALERVETSEGSLYWIVPDPEIRQDPEVSLLLERHGGRDAQVLTCGFDHFFGALGSGLRQLASRRRVAERLNDAWRRLERSASFGLERAEILEDLLTEAVDLAKAEPNDEALALLECVSYQRQPRGESYRLEHGVTLLRRASRAYEIYRGGVKLEDTVHAEFALLTAMRDLFLVGSPTISARRDYLGELLGIGRRLLERVAGSPFWEARCHIAIAEALKERAMVTAPPLERRSDFMESRGHCEQAQCLLARLEHPSNAFLQGCCLRHLAITYELEAIATVDGGSRERLYQQWSMLSGEAVELLATIGEDGVRGYALMNRASSFTRLAGFRSLLVDKLSLLRRGKADLLEAEAALQGVHDVRGLVWTYVHLCENLRSENELSVSVSETSVTIQVEEYAVMAVCQSRLIEDQLAIALALRELGIALSRTDSLPGPNDLRTDRSISSLWESAQMLERLGYQRGAGYAYRALGDVLARRWDQGQDIGSLVEGTRAVAAGIVSMAEAIGATDFLYSVFSRLRGELSSVLDT